MPACTTNITLDTPGRAEYAKLCNRNSRERSLKEYLLHVS